MLKDRREQIGSTGTTSDPRRMKCVGYVHWQDGDMWLGYLEEFPDYMTQGESVAELEENLRDIYDDLTNGKIPSVRRRGELQIA